MRVRALVPFATLRHAPEVGQVLDVDESYALDWASAGYVEIVDDEANPPTTIAPPITIAVRGGEEAAEAIRAAHEAVREAIDETAGIGLTKATMAPVSSEPPAPKVEPEPEIETPDPASVDLVALIEGAPADEGFGPTGSVDLEARPSLKDEPPAPDADPAKPTPKSRSKKADAS